MKIKKLATILVAVMVSLMAFDASAYYKNSYELPDRQGIGWDNATSPFSYIEPESNPIYKSSVDTKNASWWRVRYYTDAAQLVYLGYDNGVLVEPVNSNGNSGGINLAQKAFSKDADGHWICTAPADGTYRFRYEFGTNLRPYGRDLAGMRLQAIVKSDVNADEFKVNIKAYVSPSKLTMPDYTESTAYRWTIMDFGALQPNSSDVQELECNALSGETWALGYKRIKAVDIVFYNVKANDMLGVVGFEAITNNVNDPSNVDFDPTQFFAIPVVCAGNADGSDFVTHIQAEDFDEPWINGRIGHSPVGGNSTQFNAAMRRYAEDTNVALENHGACFIQYGLPHDADKKPHSDAEFGVYNNCYWSSPQWGAIPNMYPHADEEGASGWQVYKGDYLDDTSNLVSFEDAVNNFGSWLEYTIDAEEDMNLDLSFRRACSWGSYSIIMSNGSTYGKPREEMGYMIDGLEEDYVKKYGFMMRVALDGKLLRTNWDVRPVYEPGMTEEQFSTLIKTPQEWTNCQEQDDEGNLVNSTYLSIFPHPNHNGESKMNQTEFYETWQMLTKCAASTDVPAKISRANNTSYVRPDYADIPLPKGRHTIKVQSLGGQWLFDHIRVVGKPKAWDTPTGVDTVGADSEDDAAEDAPVEVYNLQGIRMAGEDGLAPGIYVKRSGKRVEKFVVR